jgi:sensor histidine kinase regulating citrate/malate metabolism
MTGMDTFDFHNWLLDLSNLLKANKVREAKDMIDKERAEARKRCEAVNKVIRDLY